MSSSSAAKIGQPMMVLELFLKVNEDDQTGINHSGNSVQRVVVEMNKEEAREFAAKLQGIQKEIVALSAANE